MQFKKDDELTEEQKKQKKKANIPYTPGKIYLYQYKDVPKPDLEILFPNVRISMNWKDRIMLGVPAIAAAVLTFIKVGSQIALVALAISVVFFGKKIDAGKPEDLMAAAVAFLGILVAFGGLCFKQYSSVKNKRIQFLKDVSEHLFFRNIAMNKAVFDRIIDDGEDEDCKEAMLVYYHILSTPEVTHNRESLDTKIQDWMNEKFDTVIDFDIDGPIEKLKKFQGKTNSGEVKSLITEGPDGALQIPTLQEANQIMDYHWDNAFSFSKSEGGPSC